MSVLTVATRVELVRVTLTANSGLESWELASVIRDFAEVAALAEAVAPVRPAGHRILVQRATYGSPVELLLSAGAMAASLLAIGVGLRDWRISKAKAAAEASLSEANAARAWLELRNAVMRAAADEGLDPNTVERQMRSLQGLVTRDLERRTPSRSNGPEDHVDAIARIERTAMRLERVERVDEHGQ